MSNATIAPIGWVAVFVACWIAQAKFGESHWSAHLGFGLVTVMFSIPVIQNAWSYWRDSGRLGIKDPDHFSWRQRIRAIVETMYGA
jgi:hypothetical protein